MYNIVKTVDKYTTTVRKIFNIIEKIHLPREIMYSSLWNILLRISPSHLRVPSIFLNSLQSSFEIEQLLHRFLLNLVFLFNPEFSKGSEQKKTVHKIWIIYSLGQRENVNNTVDIGHTEWVTLGESVCLRMRINIPIRLVTSTLCYQFSGWRYKHVIYLKIFFIIIFCLTMYIFQNIWIINGSEVVISASAVSDIVDT